MKLPSPSPQYNPMVEAQRNVLIERADNFNLKRGNDIEIGPPQKLILRSPDGARWEITVSNSGVIAASAL